MTGTTWVDLGDGVTVEVGYAYNRELGEIVERDVRSDTDIWRILTGTQQDQIDEAIVDHAIGERV